MFSFLFWNSSCSFSDTHQCLRFMAASITSNDFVCDKIFDLRILLYLPFKLTWKVTFPCSEGYVLFFFCCSSFYSWHLYLSSPRQICLCVFNYIAGHNSNGAECYLCEEFLYIFPVISLLSSPSKSIKAAAAFLLSSVEKLLLDLLNLQVKPKASEDEFLHIIKQKSIPFRLLHHLWFQVTLIYELFPLF